LDENSEILVNLSESYYYFNYVTVPMNGFISLNFASDPKVLAHVTLKGEEAPGFIDYGGFDINISRAIDSARVFLSLNGIESGKYLEHRLDYGLPNFFWHRRCGMMHPLLPEAVEYVAVRFEQPDRPGHYLELWVHTVNNQVVGGDMCR